MDVDGDKDVEMASENESDDMSDDLEKEAELNEKKKILAEKIQNDKTDYFAYLELIQVLSELGQFEEMRKTREDFSIEYPLTAEMWLSWIEDEKKIAATVEEKQYIKSLFERALEDYLSVDVWSEYIQFSMGLMSDGNPIECVRSILERAVSICGYNVAQGSLLWNLYRVFEKMVLASIESSDCDEEKGSKKREQNRRIAETYRRQLSIPLLEMENTYEELRSWLNEDESLNELIDLKFLEANYKKALDKLSKILSFEESLLSCKPEASLPIYERYLKFEENPKEGGNDIFRVRCLYERAVIDNPVKERLWDKYIKYLSNVGIPEDIMHTCRRAIRNYPQDGKFWCQLMVLMEKSMKSKEEINDLLNKGVTALTYTKSGPRSIWLAYIHYLRRQLYLIPKDDSEKWTKSVDEIREVADLAFQYFGIKGDPECKLLLWCARFEAETCHNLERFRSIWTNIMNLGFSDSSAYWLKYIQMEWQYGDTKHMRKLFQRALTSIKDWPQKIIDEWMDYESQIGSLDSFLNCQKICNERLKQYEERKSEKSEENKKNKNLKEDSNAKIRDTKSKDYHNSREEKIEKLAKKESPEKPKASEAGSSLISHDPSKDSRTVFISNLDFTVVEDDVRKVLNAAGKIEEFRLVRDFKGRSKGFGYLVLSTKSEALAALKFDRTPVNQRPMFVSECEANRYSRKTGLRFCTGVEKNKLFVKGLPINVDKSDLEKLFSPYGVLKDVRIVLYRNGHSKGLAYVEFEEETSAAAALLKTDGLEIDGKPISVSISNPPERKNETSLMSSNTDSITGATLGGGVRVNKNDTGSRGRGRTQLSFVPRALTTAKMSGESIGSEKMDVTAEPIKKTTAKTNADFRNMLLNPK